MNFFDHSKEAYFRELERLSELRRALSLPTGIGIVLGGGAFSLVKSYPWQSATNWLALPFIVISGALAISLGFAVYYLSKALFGHEYAYVPTPKEVLDYHSELKAYYEQQKVSSNEADVEVERYMLAEYASNSHDNALSNNEKSAKLFRANASLALAVFFISIASIIYIVTNYGDDSEQRRRQKETAGSKAQQTQTASKPVNQRERR